ncbi:hypothetical protein [Chamaesiphon sp. OTE_75_metabat_556]|uniref:hypothetical protein n=1 Tax=Chamaesiphon sp. OTE_75_metabat_556 TaxID=2964692 RepID=UPI00286A4637|nr:hypothetical protein [Chamaesiphon sp. OTE_75_metabat_556]
MLRQLACLSLAIAISFTPNPSNAQLTDRMPSHVRALIYRQVCQTYKYHGLTTEAILEQTKDLYLSNANFDSIPNDLSANELDEIKSERKILATKQAGGMLSQVRGDNNCHPAH